MSVRKFDASVVGELNLDLILYGLSAEFELDREHLASDWSIALGSFSAIFAHNCALLANRVAFHSAIGDDPMGELCLRRLAESGVDVLFVKRLPLQKTGLTVILPRPLEIHPDLHSGVMAEMRFEDLDLDRVFSARHTSSLILLPSAGAAPQNRRALSPRQTGWTHHFSRHE
jgi:sugar/nucleoside kinase (ribokinase family)